MEIKKVLLGSVCEVRGRVGWKGYTTEDLRESGPLVIGANDILPSDRLDLSKAKHLSRGKYEESPEIYIQKGDILVVKIGSTIGKVAIVSEDIGEATINPNCVIVRPTKISPLTAYYCLCSKSSKAFLINNSKASGQSALSQESLKKLPMFVPAKESEDALSIIADIDAKIDNNNAICADLEGMAKLLYDYWFVQFDFPDENGRPYKSSGGKMVWNEELKREIPEGWEVTNIGSITTCHDSERIPVSGEERKTMAGEIPYYGATGIMGYVNKAIFNGEYVLLAEDGSVMDDKGHPILQRLSGAAWVNNHTHVLEPIKGYSCRLLMLILKDIPVMQIKTGSIQMKINQENLNEYRIVEIPPTIRALAVTRLSPIDSALLNLKAENAELSSLRDFLLPMLMNGQVKVKGA